MPNLEDNAVNLSVLAGLCATEVSLFTISQPAQIKIPTSPIFKCTNFSSSTGPLIASTLPYFLFLVEMS